MQSAEMRAVFIWKAIGVVIGLTYLSTTPLPKGSGLSLTTNEDLSYEKQKDNSIRLQATVDEIFETCAKEI